jgi:hypothetical protein
MMPHHSYSPLAMVGRLWLCVMLHSVWPSRGAVAPLPPEQPVPLAIRQRVVAGGRRVNPRCPSADGRQPQRTGCHAYDHVVLVPASMRHPLRAPQATNGSGAVQGGPPWTPARAAGWTEHVWPRPERRLWRGPPWPPPQAVSRVGGGAAREAREDQAADEPVDRSA